MCNRTRRTHALSPKRVKFANDGKYAQLNISGTLFYARREMVPDSSVSTVRKHTTMSPSLQKGLSQKDAKRKEGRKMQKNFAIAKISEEGRERKKFRGSLSAENARVGGGGVGGGRGKMRGAHRLPTFWGRGGEGRVEDAATETEAAATAICSNLRFAATTMI